MWTTILNYRLDEIAFVVLALAGTLTVHIYVKRACKGKGLGGPAWTLFVTLLAAGIGLAEWTGDRAQRQLKAMTCGLAPTYAAEMSKLGHSRISMTTPADDPTYLTLIDAEKRWLRLNPSVNDIYTFRRDAEGKFRLIVDSETDYNHDGAIDEDREQRTAIGEVYDHDLPSWHEAVAGKPSFDGEPYSDRWGSWVSAYEPLYGPDGTLDGALGVDLDASLWVMSILESRVGALGYTMIAVVTLIVSRRIITLTRSEMDRRRAAETEREKLQRQLVDASRQAGMAEIANGVLHNVGNVLNSVNMSAHVLTDKIRDSRMPNVEKAAKLLVDNAATLPAFLTADERGKQLPTYLQKLGTTLQSEHEQLRETLRGLTEGLDHIKSIVQSQQQIARKVTLCEPVQPHEVFEDALKLNMSSCERHKVTVVREFDEVPTILLDRHKIIQILINLISNAKNALSPLARTDKTIRVRLSAHPSAEQPYVEFAVLDNGSGISADNMPKIFSHGFTTRKEGHGFGLHSAANLAQEMGGSLTAHSDGPGSGAQFVLKLPFKVEEVKCNA